MPSGKTHAIAAVVVSSALTCGMGMPTEYVVIAVIGGWAPDVDHRTSTLGLWLPFWLFFRHRGCTHSFLGLLLSSGLLFFFVHDPWAMMAFGVGYMSHLLLDWMTPMGVPLWWPRQQRYSLRR